MEPLLGLNKLGISWDFAGICWCTFRFKQRSLKNPWPLCGAHSNNPFDWSRYVSSIGTWHDRIFGCHAGHVFHICIDDHWCSLSDCHWILINFSVKKLAAKIFSSFSFGGTTPTPKKKNSSNGNGGPTDQRDRRLDPSDWFVAAISNVVPPWSFASMVRCSAPWHTSLSVVG